MAWSTPEASGWWMPKSRGCRQKVSLTSYSAAHAFSLAAMRWHGYRPANKRYVVFQVLGQTLGMKPEVWRILDKCHGIRNSFEYDGSFNVDEQLLKDLIAATEKAKNAVEKLAPVPRHKTKGK